MYNWSKTNVNKNDIVVYKPHSILKAVIGHDDEV